MYTGKVAEIFHALYIWYKNYRRFVVINWNSWNFFNNFTVIIIIIIQIDLTTLCNGMHYVIAQSIIFFFSNIALQNKIYSTKASYIPVFFFVISQRYNSSCGIYNCQLLMFCPLDFLKHQIKDLKRFLKDIRN